MTDRLPQDGLVAVVKRDCPTCVLAAPVLGALARDTGLTVYTQDDPTFPETVPGRIDDRTLDISHRLKIEIVPTLIRFEAGREAGRTYGWDRAEWQRLTGVLGLGRDLPEARPGCGAKNVEPGVIERLKVRFNETGLKSRRIEIGADEDEQLVGRPAAGTPDRRARAAHARRHVARPSGGPRAGAARSRAGDSRENRGQCGDGRLQTGISAGRIGGSGGGARRRVRDARRIGDDDVCRARRRRERPGPPPHWHER